MEILPYKKDGCCDVKDKEMRGKGKNEFPCDGQKK